MSPLIARTVNRWRFNLVTTKPNRKRWVVPILALSCASAHAQSPYPTTGAPQGNYGGYTVAEAVPYQPTMQPYEQLAPMTECCPPGEVAFPTAVGPSGMKPWLPGGGRNGVFQKVKFTGTYLPRFEEDAVGMSDLQLLLVLGLGVF
jgi:hypothetical protein